ncbi:hypothetical protein LXA43DRAFT_977208 [Ganoderma leucocontextum]|nr:hypothetical protein LXA43DRAFT_977208 [Ganoderma leucocontextum]
MQSPPESLFSGLLAESDVTVTAVPFAPRSRMRPETGSGLPSIDDLRKELEQEIKTEFTDQEKTDVWKKYAETVRTHHDELVGRWQKDMDNLLIYASLFSAVLTAFNVQSYQLLQPAPTDPSLAVLQQISQQLSSFSVSPSFVNSTRPARPLDVIQPRFHAPASAVWINALWFSSLICSLASVSIALMVQQWLHDVRMGLSGTSLHNASRRQHRHNVLLKWRVDIIVLIPSILVQLALVLFLLGLVVLLWTLHQTVAIVGTSLVGTLFLFLIVVICLPVFKWDCCYRSPQAQAVYIVVRHALRAFAHTLEALVKRLRWPNPTGSRPSTTKESDRWMSSPSRIMLKMPTWRGREERHVSNARAVLACNTAVMAFTTTFDPEHLDKLHIVLPDLDTKHLASCFDDIFAAIKEQLGGHPLARDRYRKTVLMRPLLYAARYLYMRVPRLKSSRNELDRLCGVVLDQIHPAAVDDSLIEHALATFSLFAMEGTSRGKKGNDKLHRRYFDKWDSRREALLDGESFVEHQLRPLYVILSCAANALFADTCLSPEEAQGVTSRARSALSTFQRNLASFTGSDCCKRSCTPRPHRGLSRRNGLKFITWVRLKLDDNIVTPLLALCLNPRSAEVVSDEVVAALQDNWTAAKDALHVHLVPRPQDVDSCPALVESHDGRYFPVNDRRSIKEFEAKLARLRTVVRNRKGESNGQVLAKPSISVQVPSPAGSIAALPPV